MKDPDKTIDYLNDIEPRLSHDNDETERLGSSGPAAPRIENEFYGDPYTNQEPVSKKFCPQCGYPNYPNANFCNRCGSALNSSANVNSQPREVYYENSSNPYVEPTNAYLSGENNPKYKRLGGFLGFIVYSNLILNPIAILVNIYSLYQYTKLKDQYIYSGLQNIYNLNLLNSFVSIVACVFYFWFALQIKNRNPNFLKYYNITASAYIVIVATMEIFLSVSAAFMTLIIGALGIFLLTLYFVKSKRVRGYFGSTDYIRLNPFTRNFAD